MSLHALVFCSDERILRILRRVLSDMEIRVDQCSTADSAIQKLTRSRFEAVVVDCADEQVAALVLNSVRTAPTNRRAVAVAIIDGEKAVKSAFALGAHFVLYKPISMERAKTGFRAARALMKRERRRNQRVPLEISVALITADERRETTTADLGEGGMAIQTGRVSRNSHTLRVQFTLPGEDLRIDCAAEVAWENANRQTGLRFVDISPQQHSDLRRWLERYAPEEMVAEDPPVSCKLADLTAAACYLETDTPFPLNANVSLSTQLPGAKARVEAVVRIMHPDAGMGLEFVQNTSLDREQVEQFVRHLQDNQDKNPEILVEPEGLEASAPPSRVENRKDPLLELFKNKKDLMPQAFLDELHKHHIPVKALKHKAAAASFSV